MPSTVTRPAPATFEPLAAWIHDRIHESSPGWRPWTRRARLLPVPVNLPGMAGAFWAVLARYRSMPPEWCADVVQGFMARWLTRPESHRTIARSALLGLQRGQVDSIEAGIAWKLRREVLSQACRAYKRSLRRRDMGRRMRILVSTYRRTIWMLGALEVEAVSRSPIGRVDSENGEQERSARRIGNVGRARCLPPPLAGGRKPGLP